MNATKNKFSKRIKEVMKKERVIYNSNNHYYNILKDYKSYLSSNNYSKRYSLECIKHIKYFLSYLEKEEIFNIYTINKKIIINYINTFPNYYSKLTIKNYFKHLRILLKYFFYKKMIKDDLSIYVPKIKNAKNSTIPSIWTIEEINKIFNQIDLNTALGKRAYLVLILTIKYGLRSLDISNLKFNNIDWKNKRISIIQSKTKNRVTFPLLPEISNALIDYIKNARPISNEEYIILTNDGRHSEHNLINPYLYSLIKSAGIECGNRKKGIHSMRHTLASLLLKENIPLPIISTILGHSNTSTTTIYLKIDKNQLEQCCLDLSEVKINE